MMKDVDGTMLKLGDIVAIAAYDSIEKGRVVGYDEDYDQTQVMTLDDDDPDDWEGYDSSSILKIGEGPVMLKKFDDETGELLPPPKIPPIPPIPQ